MKFQGASLFFRTLIGTRVMWLAGRFGGGKTLLSFAVSEWLYRNRYVDHVVSNIPSPMTDHPRRLWVRDKWSREGRQAESVGRDRWETWRGVPPAGEGWRPGLANTAIVFDEAWILLDSREWKANVGRTIGAYLRKFNLFLLLPSVFPVDKRFRAMTVQRTVNLNSFGVPGWLYKWSLEQGKVESDGWFISWLPRTMFGSYDHLAAPSGDGGIVAAMQDTVPDVVSDTRDSEFTGDLEGYDRMATKSKRQARRGGRGSR